MTNLKPYFLLINLLFCLVLLVNCQAVDVRGQYINNEMVEEINSLKPSQQQLIKMFGLPNFIPDYNDNVWYYMYRSIARKAWVKPKILSQRIVKITFNQNQELLIAELLENQHNKAIIAENSFTKTGGTEQTIIQKFTKNFGRFSGNSKKKSKK